MTALVKLIGVPGIKVVDCYLVQFIHNKCVEIYVEISKNAGFMTTYLNSLTDGSYKQQLKSFKGVINLPVSLLTVGLAVYFRKIMWETAHRNNNDAIPIINV